MNNLIFITDKQGNVMVGIPDDDFYYQKLLKYEYPVCCSISNVKTEIRQILDQFHEAADKNGLKNYKNSCSSGTTENFRILELEKKFNALIKFLKEMHKNLLEKNNGDI